MPQHEYHRDYVLVALLLLYRLHDLNVIISVDLAEEQILADS